MFCRVTSAYEKAIAGFYFRTNRFILSSIQSSSYDGSDGLSRSAFVIFITLAILIPIGPILSQDDKVTGLPGLGPLGPRGPSLRLDSDQELMDAAAAFGWSGNGSRTSPFIIADYVMNGSSGGSGIYLGNTTLHVEIGNCSVLRTSFVIKNYGEGAGITLFGVSNVSIKGCNASTNLIGFHIIASRNVSIEGSDISWNYMYGIHVTASDDIFIESSNVEYNDFGIYVTDSNNVTVTGSHCHDNDDHGVRLDNSHNCNVWNSTFEHNDDGVNLGAGSSLNNVSLNVMMDCRESAIAIGEAENNYFHGNIMTNCSFYFPLEPLTVRYNVIPRSNRINGKGVQFIWNVNKNMHQSYDLSEIGQLIMFSSSKIILSNMSANGGSQAVVVKDCGRLFLENMTISNQLFHAIIMYNSPMISVTNCTISNCYNGLDASFSYELTMTGVIIESTVSPLSLTLMDQLFMDRCKLMDNELGISLNNVYNSFISELTSIGCGNADVRSLSTAVSFIGCNFISRMTSLDLDHSSIISYASSFKMTLNSPIISTISGSVTLLNNTFTTANIIKEPTFHPFKIGYNVDFVMEGNNLYYFGLLPDQVFPNYGDGIVVGPGNKVNGRPLLFLQGSDMKGAILTEPFGQVFLKDVSNLHISNQSFKGSCVGVAISGSLNITVANSTFSDCIWGISVLQSINVNIRFSNFSSNNNGIIFKANLHSNNAVEGSFFNNNKVGCLLYGQSVNIRNNTFLLNTGTGVEVYAGSYNVIYDNLIMDNLGPGVMVEDGPGWNLIYRNAFIRNNGSGPEFSKSKLQGYDRVTNHWSREGVGNFWYDMSGPDTDGDLIVDDPYPLFGGKGSDTTPMARIPTAVLPPPIDIEVNNMEDTYLISWSAPGRPLLPVTGFRVRFNGALVQDVGPEASDCWVPSSELAIGNFTISTLCEFGEGEDSLPSPSRNETDPPLIEMMNSDRTELNSGSSSLLFKVTDLSGVRKATCQIDGTLFYTSSSFVGDLFIVPLAGLPEGPRSVTVKAIDRFGNTAELSFSVLIDDSPPLTQVTLPDGRSIFNTRTLDVWYNVIDNIGTVDRYEMRLDGENVTVTGPAGTVLLSGLREGEHTLELFGTDLAGNVGSSSLKFIIDLSPPRVLSYHPQGDSVGFNTTIEIELSEPLVSDTALTLNGMGPAFISVGNRILSAELRLQPSTDYQVTVTGKDEAGNQMVFEWLFRTGISSVTPVKVTGRTVDAEGRPLSDVEITADCTFVKTTGADGMFELQLLPGNHTLELRCKGYKERKMEVTVSQGPVNDLGDIILVRINDIDDPDRGLWLLVLAGLALIAVLGISVLVSAVRNRGGGQPEE